MLHDLKWDQVIFLRFGQKVPVDFLRAVLAKRAIEYQETLYSRSSEGYGSLNDLSSIIDGAGGKLVLEEIEKQSGETLVRLYLFEDHFLCASERFNHVCISVEGFDADWMHSLLTSLTNCLTKEAKKGTIMMLASEDGSFFLVQLGEIDCPLERGNYSDKILAQYDNVVADLKIETPSGRLTILDGLAGCGKSFMIRGLISEVEALYIYVPANIAGTLSGPEVMPVFLRERNRNLPIVLIMEDADASIATRQIDNVGVLSDLLNMSDGILGDMADLRIIATTNAKKTEIDPAVSRVGRVNEHISFPQLDKQHALNIFTRLTGINEQENGGIKELQKTNATKTNLASVYNLARQHGWTPGPRRKKKEVEDNYWHPASRYHFDPDY